MAASRYAYRMRAARPAAAMKMGIAVACAPRPELLDDELPPALPVEETFALMVVLPMVLTKVEEPEVTVLTIAAVETAVEFPELPAPAAP
jgi:hypothetical protein